MQDEVAKRRDVAPWLVVQEPTEGLGWVMTSFCKAFTMRFVLGILKLRNFNDTA